MFFECSFLQDNTEETVRLQQCKARHHSAVPIEDNVINNISVQELDKRMATVNWKDYFSGAITDEKARFNIGQILTDLWKLSMDNNSKGDNIQQKLTLKYFPHSKWNEDTERLASAKITMARLASPQLYYVLTGNDFMLDLNNPKEPKIICMGNNYLKQQVYGAVLSLYISRMTKLVNRKKQLKSSLIFDEFPTIYFNNIDSLIATARSNLASTCLGVQDFSQLRKDYGKEQADVISNIVGNIVCGQVTGDTAEQLSKRFGRIMQERESLSINSGDTTISRSTHLESAIPASRISSLSSGEVVGAVADNLDEKVDLKVFHCEIQNDHAALKVEQDNYKPIPAIRNITPAQIEENYRMIKEEVFAIIKSEMERIYDTPELAGLLVVKNE